MAVKQNDIERIFADENNLRILINHMDDPIWLVDTDCNLVECNTAFKKWISCFVGKELDKGDNVLSHELCRIYQAKFAMCYEQALSGNSFTSIEDMQIGGETRYTTINFNPVFDTDNVLTGVSCFARDITEKRRHLMKIEEQNAILLEIASIESHRVRGPVATILGLEQFFNYENLADPINKDIMEGINKVSLELDCVIREIVKKSNDIGLQ